MAITNDLPSVFCWVSQMASSPISSFIRCRQLCGELLRDRFRLGTRRITHDGDYRMASLIMYAIKVAHILDGDFFHTLHFARAKQRIRMCAEHRFLKSLFCDTFRLG